MARSRRGRKRPYGQGHIPLNMDRLRSVPRVEPGPGGAYHVQEVRARKAYTCPGCGGQVSDGAWHVVAWPEEGLLGRGPDERRHWHTGCWKARFGRRPAW